MKLLNNLTEVPPGRYRYTQPETKATFGPYGNLALLVSAVQQHRISNNLPAGDNLPEELQDWICRELKTPDGFCHEEGDAPVRRYAGAKTPGGNGWDGSHKWAELHRYALTPEPDHLHRAAWLVTFTQSIPCGECKRNWRKLVAAHPVPDTFTDSEFFEWTVKMHNLTSAEIGKPQLSVEDARTRWSLTP